MTPTTSAHASHTSVLSLWSARLPAVGVLALAGLLATGCEGDPVKDLGAGDEGPVHSPVDTADQDIPAASYDLDHDGYPADVDCDDNDWSIHPEAEEACDGKDNDCDGTADEGWDVDGDGHLPFECDGGDDCDDGNPSVNPSADDIPYDGVDQDCDGEDNLDADGDGFDALEVGGNDCDDENPDAYPGAPEVAKDGVDQNCDGVDLLDGDGDGYDDEAFGGTDCNDNDSTIYPDAWEWMNDEIDSDCDGTDGRPVDMTDSDVIFSGAAGYSGYFGFAMDACDFDGDGTDDLVITAPLAESNLGQVGIYFSGSAGNWDTAGAMSDADVIIEGEELAFGMGVACGDIDGDGLTDLIAESGEYGPYESDVRLSVWYGASGWTAEMYQVEADAELTIDIGAGTSDGSVYSMGFGLEDVDNDGSDDLIIVADVSDDLEGMGDPDDTVWLIPGGTWTGTQQATDVVTTRITPDQDNVITGVRVVDDWNGDGERELVLEQGNYWTDVTGTEYTLGRLSFISGWPATDGQAADLAFASLEGSNGFDSGFGRATMVEDLDGDGAVDLVSCAPYTPYSTRTNSGACYVFDDVASDVTATGLTATTYSDMAVVSGYQDGYFGAYGDMVPDVTGDGNPDFLVVEPAGGTGSRGRSIVVDGALMASVGGLPDDVSVAEFSHTNNYSGVSQTRLVSDIDGDGMTDFVFGAYAYGVTSSGSGTYQGRVWVWMSSRYLN